jgi:NAD(P)-dependent dehydrogenase (short-subunit alcohol dehydrogenase family)
MKHPEGFLPRPDLLKDRVLLITGAGYDIGAAVAQAAAACGATVILLGRQVRPLEVVYDAIEAAGGPQPAIYPLNLETAGEAEYSLLAQRLAIEFGRLDGVLHAAAELGTLSPINFYRPEEWNKVLQTNLTAPFLLTRAVLELLKQSADASVLFTSADVGRQGRAYWGAYGVAYAGVENLAQSLAAELEENTPIRVNTIDPGKVRTELRARAYPGEDPSLLPTPDQIVNTYLYLLGPDSRGTTGRQFNAV